MKNELYTPEGWLNFKYIDSFNAWLNVIIGSRQVGKTYGTLKLMLQENRYHVLLRRTTAEVETISASPDLNPYAIFEPDFHIALFKNSKKLCRISDYIINDKNEIQEGKQRGIITSLSEIAHVRGFNGSAFTDLVFDEFIPEKGVISRTTEGDAFLNAYTTINGNRELQGKPPLRAWLLANSNNVMNYVLEALNLTDIVLDMRRRKKEVFLTDDNTLIIQPSSVQVLQQRKQTALMQRISEKSSFYGMAINNDFSYDQSDYVKTISIKHLKPVFRFGSLYCWERAEGFYICRAPGKVPDKYQYEDSNTGRERFVKDFAFLLSFYFAGAILFSDLRALAIFRTLFNI